jgi:hypothetical protein
MSVRLRIKHHRSHGIDFYEIWYLSFNLKYAEKIQVLLKCDKNNGHVTWRHFYSYDNILLNYSYNERCFRQKL